MEITHLQGDVLAVGYWWFIKIRNQIKNDKTKI